MCCLWLPGWSLGRAGWLGGQEWRLGGQRRGCCSHQACKDVARAELGTTGQREAGGGERDGADHLATPTCPSMHLNPWLSVLLRDLCTAVLAPQNQQARGAGLGWLWGEHQRTPCKGGPERSPGNGVQRESAQRHPSLSSVSRRPVEGPLAVSRDHFIGPCAQVGWRASQE